SPEQLESMGPLIAQKTGDAPQHAQRLDGAGALDLAHIGRLPAELVEQAADRLLGRLVVPADEHGRLAAGELWVDHACVAYRVERLDQTRVPKLALQLLHQGFVEIGEELEHTVAWRRIGDRVGGVD